MRILMVSVNEWADTNSLGNTTSNFFAEFNDVDFMNLYFRSFAPDNSVCKKYYQISEKALLTSLFSKKYGGRYFEITEEKRYSKVKSSNCVKRMISFLHRYKLSFVYTVFDYLYSLQTWQNQDFRTAIAEFFPEIVFAFARADAPYYYSLKYLKEHTNAKIVLFCADDVYTAYRNSRSAYSKKFVKRFRELMNLADKIYGISNEMCEFYQKEFGKPISVLQKGCYSFAPVKACGNEKIKLVYAGSLYCGRYDILSKISAYLEKYQSTVAVPIQFEIYSGDTLSEADRNKLENSCTRFMGSRSYGEIVKILANSDIVLHAESFEQEQIQKVRYSFSTKITDCLESGCVLLVVGPRELASVAYAKQIPGSIVIDSLDALEEGIEHLISKIDVLPALATATQEFAKRNHAIENVKNRLTADFLKLLEKSS